MMTCLVLEGFFGEGSSLILVWVADVLCFHEDDQTRQYHCFSTIACGFRALPSVRAISDCKPVAMEMEVGGERRDEVHEDRLLPVAALGPKSPLRALRAQLAELGRPTYGSNYHCWKRLQRAQEARAEADAVARHDEAMAVGAADVQVPGRPVEPLSEERERDTMCHTYRRSRGASIACVDELLKEITSGSRLSKRTGSFPSLRLILPS